MFPIFIFLNRPNNDSGLDIVEFVETVGILPFVLLGLSLVTVLLTSIFSLIFHRVFFMEYPVLCWIWLISLVLGFCIGMFNLITKK